MKKELRKVIHNSFEDHETEINVNEIWDGIQEKRNKKKRRVIPIWFIGVLGSFIILTIIGISLNKGVIDNKTHIQTALDSDSLNAKNNEGNLNHNRIEQSELLVDTESDITNNETNYSKPQTIKLNTEKENNITNPVIESGENKKITSNTNSNEIGANKTNLSSKLNNELQLNNDVISRTLSNEATISESNPFYKVSKDYIDLLSPISAQINFEIEKPLLVFKDNILQRDQNISTDNLKYSKLQLSLVGGAAMASRDASSATNALYFSNRTNAENPLEKLSLKLHLSYNITKSFCIFSGLDLHVLNEKFIWNSQYLADINNIIVSQVNEVNGAEVFNFTDTYYYQKVERDIQVYNQFILLDVPVGIKYSLIKNNWTVSGFAGVGLNLGSWFEGYTLDINNIPLKIDDSNMEEKFGVNYFMGLEGAYSITNKIQLISQINLDFRRKQEIHIESKYRFFGAHIGIGIKL